MRPVLSSPALWAAPLFVAIWSTGWIVSGLVVPYADPLTFLCIRYALALVCLLVLTMIVRANWPRTPVAAGHAAMSGVLLHGVYLGGTWWGIQHGVPAGISGIIAALQPILTALLAPALLNERISPRQWQGIALGFIGIALVLWPKLAGMASVSLADITVPFFVTLLAVIGLTLGTFYQKRWVGQGDLTALTVLQYAGAFVVTFPCALLLEPMRMQWTPVVLWGLAWSVLGLSLGAISLLLYLIRRGEVARTAALMYLVPPLTSLQAYIFLNETLVSLQLLGLLITACGVALAVRRY